LGKGLAPRAGLRAVFEDGKAPQVGQLEISVEEGVFDPEAQPGAAADASVGGLKLLDATLTEDAATGLLVKQTYAPTAAQCSLCSVTVDHDPNGTRLEVQGPENENECRGHK